MKNQNTFYNEANYMMCEQLAVDAQYRIDKINRAMPIAIAATAATAVAYILQTVTSGSAGFLASLPVFLFPIAMVLGVVSYVLGSGFGEAVASVGRIAKWGWILVPVFPVDIVVGMVALFFGIAGLFFFPAFVLLDARKKAYKDLREAARYAVSWEQAA